MSPLRLSGRLRAGLATVLLLCAAAGTADAADDATALPDFELERMRDRLATRLPDVRREDIQRSTAAGLYEVRANHAFGYVTADGRYVLSGDLVDLDTGEPVTERRRNLERLRTVDALAPGAIVFAPVGVMSWITVFTDVDCEYCRLLHREVPKLNRLGIGVRYLSFSKFGAPSKAYDRARVVWCQKDAQAALNVGLLTGVVPSREPSCSNDPVHDQYKAASDMGLRGTPAVVMPDGSLFYGYAKAEKLADEMHKRMVEAARFSKQPPPAP